MPSQPSALLSCELQASKAAPIICKLQDFRAGTTFADVKSIICTLDPHVSSQWPRQRLQSSRQWSALRELHAKCLSKIDLCSRYSQQGLVKMRAHYVLSCVYPTNAPPTSLRVYTRCILSCNEKVRTKSTARRSLTSDPGLRKGY